MEAMRTETATETAFAYISSSPCGSPSIEGTEMSNSQSSETEENKIKIREAPWIHPGAVADLIRSGEAEDRDRPALIRLYIRAQMNLFANPGKSGKGKNYWPDNQTIADSLGVSTSDIQNALRDSDIERIDGGKGRGEDKRFRIVKKERNHGGKKKKRKKVKGGKSKKVKGGKEKKGRRPGRKIPKEKTRKSHVKSTCGARNIDVCQQSNLRVRHVKSTCATGLEGDGLEKKRDECEGGGKPRACARRPGSPPPDRCFSFSEKKAEEAKEFLDGFDLLDDAGLALAYYGLVSRVCGASLIDGSDDADKAKMLLKSVPAGFRKRETIRSWMIWYVSRLAPRWDKATHYLTRFSDSWSAYRPLAEKAWSDRMAERQKIRAKEIEAMERQCRESREAEKVARRRAEEARRREEAEAQAKRKMEQDAFRKTLPTPEAIREAVGAVGDAARLALGARDRGVRHGDGVG